MKILFLEPFFGGSHKDFALGYRQHSCHEITLVTMPARFWKWRMRGASLYFARHVKNFSGYDAIFTTDMMDLTDFRSFAGNNLPPLVLYFHENQLSYPLAVTQKRDFHLGFTNIISAVAADKVIFNSIFHLNEFTTAAGRLIKQMPDFRPGWMIEQISEKAEVLYPGCRFEKGVIKVKEKKMQPPLIIWNHRWEYDKNPDVFFDVLSLLKEKKIPFSLALIGEKLDKFPEVFTRARKQFKEELLTFGYVESRDEYISWLKKGDIVISCAIQENFGISIVEAARFGCVPLLPDRLSYPEIIPRDLHDRVLYDTTKDFFEKLEDRVLNLHKFKRLQSKISAYMERFSWEIIGKDYDAALENLRC